MITLFFWPLLTTATGVDAKIPVLLRLKVSAASGNRILVADGALVELDAVVVLSLRLLLVVKLYLDISRILEGLFEFLLLLFI